MRLTLPTTKLGGICACQVCEHCAELFMHDGACGVCGTAFSADDLEEEHDD